MALERLLQTRRFSPRRFIARLMTRPFVCVANHLARGRAIIYKAGHPISDDVHKGPSLWMAKHESWLDIIAFPSLWPETGYGSFNGVSRSSYFGSSAASWMISQLMRKTLFVEMTREQERELLPVEQQARMRRQNSDKLRRLLDFYGQGMSVFIMPEGTSKTDGHIAPIRSGAYRLSHLVKEGTTYAVPCQPVGNTYDLLSAPCDGRNKVLVFFHVGTPFYYEPLSGDSNDPEYVREDRRTFAETVRRAFVENTTITASQLVGYYLRSGVQSRTPVGTTFTDLVQVVAFLMARLEPLEGLHFDPALDTTGAIGSRVLPLRQRLLEQGYINKSGTINTSRLLMDAPPERYKEENPLRYMVHRLDDLAAYRKDVATALSQPVLSS